MNRPARRFALAIASGLTFLLASSFPAAAQVSLTTLGTASTQNFDGLANTGTAIPWADNTTIPGWYSTRTTYNSGTGSSNTGALYSFGSAAATDRALGGVGSGGTGTFYWAVRFVNDTGSTISSLDISYTGEQWRDGGAATPVAQTLPFEYQTAAAGTITDADTPTTGWTAFAALDFSSPTFTNTGSGAALDGNLSANKTAKSNTLTVTVAPGAEVWLRWKDINDTGNDHGLAIDDLSVTPQGAAGLPNLTLTDVSANEGNAGTTTFTFTVSLSAPAGAGGVTFDIATADGTATQPSDYTQKSLTGQTIPAGSSTYTFDVLVNGDTVPETNETFFVNVTNVTGANVTDGQGQGTIVNDDAAPNLTINDVSHLEGNAGTTTYTFIVSLSAPAGAGGVTFDIATADGTAIAPGDYTAKALTGQTIPAGSSTYAFVILVNGDTTVESNETFFVNVTNATNAIITDGQGLGTITNDDFTPIHDIQGSGAASPLVGNVVTTRGVVTGLKYNNGFFLQEPDATVDADPNTSEGIYVYTGAVPTVAVGDFVEVTATVLEYAPGRGSLTELGTPTVVVNSSGNPLPVPIVLTTILPDPTGTWNQLERLEGMRVSVASFTVTAPTTGSTNEPNATGSSNGVVHGVVTGVPLPLREAGIQWPDVLPLATIPRWDSNPELLRLDSDGQVGAAQLNLSGGAILTGVVGPLDFAFDRYTILPDTATPPTVTPGIVATAVATPLATEFTVASYNLERFFDTVNDPATSDPVLTPTAFANRLRKASLGIRNYLKTPDVLGVAEVENLTTLQAIAAQISTDAIAAGQPDPLYASYLVEGNDVGGIDVGFLVKTAIVAGATPRVEVLSVTQELDGTLFVNADSSTETLNDRPPLRLMAIVHHANGASYPVTVIVNHLRSMSGVDDNAAGSNGWTTVGDRVRAKRLAQAVDLAILVQARQAADPAERIILVGDFNAFDLNDGYGDSMSTIAGLVFNDNVTTVPGDGTNLVDPDFINLATTAPAAERYSFVFDGSRQSLDHVLVNAPLVSGTVARRLEHPRINADFPENARSLYGPTDATRLSDHDPLVGFFQVAAFASAGITTTMTDAPDPVFAGAGLAYTITVTNGGPAAATGLTLTDVLPAGTTFASLTSAAGWSCSTPAVGAAGTVTCTAATLTAPSGAVFTLNVTVGAAVAPLTVLSNTASVTQTSTEATPGDESATATTTVQTPPAVYATKSASSPVAPGGPLTYTIVLTNNGTSAQADNPGNELVDVLPSSLTLVSASATSGTAVATIGTNTVTWNGTIPAAGSVTVTILAQVGAGLTVGASISNQATVSYDADGNGTNETSVPSDDPETGAVGDPTTSIVTLGAGGVTVVPTLDGFGLGLLAGLVALGGALLLGRRLS